MDRVGTEGMIRIFKHFIPVQLVFLAALEALVLFLSMYVGVALRFSGLEFSDGTLVGAVAPRAFVFMIVMMVVMTAFGMFTRESQTADSSYYVRFLISFLAGGIALSFVFYILPVLHIGRGVLALTFMIAFAGSALIRILFVRLVDLNNLKRRMLVLGTGTRAARIGALIEQDKSIDRKYELVGYFPTGDGPRHLSVPQDKLIREKGSLLAIVTRYAIDELVVAIRDRRNSGMNMNELLECKMEGVHVTDITTYFERETGHVQLDSLNPSWMVYSDGFIHTQAKNNIKRVFDIIVSLTLLLFVWPVMLVTAVLILLESGSPIFYRQERVGECGRVFQVLKFRSMRQDAEAGGKPQWAKKEDDRITRVGRVIRKLRIDELPQVINVLRGEMSFVGPRPERPFFVKELAGQIPYFLNRNTVKPGITGWAQIRYPYGSSVEDAVQKLQYDLYYAKNHSLFLDIIILFQTMQVVLFGKGAR